MKLLITLCLMIASLTSLAAPGADRPDKCALLMVHFGTTYDDTRALTIDAINAKAAQAFPDMHVAEAYTSRIVIKRLSARGIVKDTPREALLKLAAEGYTHVFIQSTNIIDGIEAAALREAAAYMTPFFKDLRIGYPLLYSVDDCQKVVEILGRRHQPGRKGAVVLVGHGTETPATAIYSQIDYMFASAGKPQYHVATVEGYPTYETVVERLRAGKASDVLLLPFMFVAGDHARNDIAGEWRERLTADGFKAEAVMEGLGQVPEIQDLFIDHIRQGLKERPLSPVERKTTFLNSFSE